VQADEPERWAATARVLFVHDWLVHLLCGVQVTEASYACAGAMADVAARTLGRRPAGALRRRHRAAGAARRGGHARRASLREGWPLPASLPVVAGCGDTQLAATGVGGLGDGVVTVVAGSSTPVQAATSVPVDDPLGRPWVSTHAAPDLWAAEGNAGYPAPSPAGGAGWSTTAVRPTRSTA
jgi:xylulokinase